ncbi:CCR4-NOT transcription complex subunit 11-like [Histomonas meleagridis]|uniref:CCR4-NOT transcription complex subunit 11-like n=1 Tax=Histomonas meleagridis TaxID=135588 RepID=UPI003559F9C0|nr:CCR4-NOT transcription complex subunit 11-like [Histomonas meleagridis]KAH0803992.1 CCR4-NOT transcription complex subunit 11-like [Histomonas meleagridis]
MIALTGISIFLSNRILTHSQQIVAIWLLSNEFNNVSLVDNPFLPLFSYLYSILNSSPDSTSPRVTCILSQILSGSSIQYFGGYSTKSILNPKFRIPQTTQNPTLHYTVQTSLPCIIIDESSISYDIQTHDQILSELLTSNLLSDFEPPHLLPPPPLLPVSVSELSSTYITSFDVTFLLDECVVIDSNEKAQTLYKKAIKSPLNGGETDALIKYICSHKELSTNIKFEEIDSLIQINPLIAKSLISQLVKAKSYKHIEKLSYVPLNAANANILKWLLTKEKLPNEIIQKIVIEMMKCSKTIRDQHVYARHVALFCTIVGKMTEEGIKFGAEMLMELYSFCMEPKNEAIDESRKLAMILST